LKHSGNYRHTPKHIVVFQTAFLGDLVLTLPLIDSARTRHPEARITAVVIPSTQSLLQGHPFVDEIIVYDKHGTESSLVGMLNLVRQLRKRRIDLALIPHRSFRTALILFLAGIRERVGYRGTPGSWLYTRRVEREMSHHESARVSALLGGEVADPVRPVIPEIPGARRQVERWLVGQGLNERPFVAMAPGSVWATKRWPWVHWIDLAGKVARKTRYNVVLVGGPDDQSLCGNIAMKAGDGVFNSAGYFDVPGSAELIRRASAIVTGDTAPLHLGVAVDTPVIALFGPTVPEFGFAPTGERDRVIGLDLDCRPCSIHGSEQCPLSHHDCMRKLFPTQVFNVLTSQLQPEADAEGYVK